jgi:hypothetical protein
LKTIQEVQQGYNNKQAARPQRAVFTASAVKNKIQAREKCTIHAADAKRMRVFIATLPLLYRFSRNLV